MNVSLLEEKLVALRKSINKSELATAFQILELLISEIPFLPPEIRGNGQSIIFRFRQYQKDKIRGNYMSGQVSVVQSQIVSSLLDFIDACEALGEGRMIPSYRGDEHKNNSFAILGNFSRREIKQLISDYQADLYGNNLSDDTFFSIGLCYLHLNSYDLAIRQFEKAIEHGPDSAEYFYYLAMAKLRGQRVTNINFDLAKEVDCLLKATLELGEMKLQYVLLSYILRIEYYLSNGLIIVEPSLEELQIQIEGFDSRKIDVWEIKRLSKFVNFDIKIITELISITL